MADEELLTSSPTPINDGLKRKHEDTELTNVTEPLNDSVSDAVDGEKNGDADDSDAKRPRLESGDGVIVADGEGSQNGHQEDPEEDPEEEVAPNTGSLVNTSSFVEPVDKVTAEPASDENQKNEGPGQTKEGAEEPSHDVEETKAESVEPSQDLAVGKTEGEEASDEVPREGDVPVESELGSDVPTLSRKIDVPNDKVGVLIGKAGDTIRSLQDNTGAKIQIMRDSEVDPRAPTRPLQLVGTLRNINRAEKLIKGVIAEADAGGSPSLIARGFSTVQAASGGEQFEMQVPIEKVGIIIGKGGETIRNMQTRSGARIQLLQTNLDGDQSKQRTVRMTGNKRQIENAKEMIRDVMSQNIGRSPLSGGYNQQGFRPRGPDSQQWGPRGHHQGQYPGHGHNYPQRGQYASPGSQYPPPYGNYPPQQGPRGNYNPSWEQRPPYQGNYNNYGQQQQGPDYGHQPAPYAQGPPSQRPPYPQGGYSDHQPYGYGAPQEQYGKPPPAYASHPQQQPYAQQQPRPIPAAQPYTQAPPAQQQPYPFAPPTGPIQPQTYPPYGVPPAADGYSQPPAAAAAYPQQAGHGYGSYPPGQPGYAEQQPASGYGYPQGQVDPAYASAPATGYAQPAPAQPAYDAYPQY